MANVSPYGRPNHCDICGKQGHDYMHCKEYPREEPAMNIVPTELPTARVIDPKLTLIAAQEKAKRLYHMAREQRHKDIQTYAAEYSAEVRKCLFRVI